MPVPIGFKHSEESKRKMSLSGRGKTLTDEHKKKISNSLKGREPWSKGRKFSAEHRAKMGLKGIKNPMYGKKWSQETREKMLATRAKYKGVPRSEAIKRKISESKKGEKNAAWKGGITPMNQRIRHSLEYRQWRTAVFERDNYTCRFCSVRGGILQADHIKRFAHYPELRFNISNGRTLCVDCHKTTQGYKNRKERVK